jgi:hypothetical protein
MATPVQPTWKQDAKPEGAAEPPAEGEGNKDKE